MTTVETRTMFVRLFACCRYVKGHLRSLVIDIQRNSYRFIDNQTYNFIHTIDGKSIEEVYSAYPATDKKVIEDNIDILQKEEFLFFTDNPELFPKMDLSWSTYSDLTNAIIEYDKNHGHNWSKIWDQLEAVGCEHVQISVYNELSISNLKNILTSVKNKRVLSIELIIPDIVDCKNKDWIHFVSQFPRIHQLVLHSSDVENKIFHSTTNMGHIYKTKAKITSHSHCGNINSKLFNISISSFTESLSHNSCLNRKISIGITGDIKICPSMPNVYGNINDITLSQAIKKPGFKKYWNITKDDIAVCKDCEFRYICTDCRAYVEDPHDKSGPDSTNLSKPLKCGYNPYTGEWAEWSTNPLKQKTIEYYGMPELVQDTGE